MNYSSVLDRTLSSIKSKPDDYSFVREKIEGLEEYYSSNARLFYKNFQESNELAVIPYG